MKKIKLKSRQKGFIFVFISIVIYAFQSTIARAILIAGVHPFVLACIKLISGFLSVLLIIFIFKKNIYFKKKDLLKWLFFGIFGGSLFALMLSNSYNLLGASQGVIYLYTAPAFTVMIAHFYLKEKITFLKLSSVLLVIFGTICVAIGSKGSSFSFNLIGFLCGIGTGLAYGIFSIMGKKLSKTYDSWNINFFYTLISSLSLLPVAPFFDWKVLFFIDFRLLIIIFLSGFLVYGLGNFLFMKSMNYLEAGEIMIFANLEPVIAIILAIVLLNENLMPLQTIGFILILIAIFLISFKKKKNKI